jgi:hypothetical protein
VTMSKSTIECGNLDGINWRAKAYKAALSD